MSAIEHIESGSLGSRWKKNFWRVLEEGQVPTQEFVAKYLDRPAVECHSPVAILSYVMDYPYFDTDDEITKAIMRLEIVKPLHRELTMQGVKSKITYGSIVLFDNTKLPAYATPEEKEEMEGLEWSKEKPAEWNLFNDRTLLASLIKNAALTVMERGDVFVLRADEAFQKADVGCCGSCRYFRSDEKGTFCGADLQSTSVDAPIGRVCTSFAPACPNSVETSSEYVWIEPEMIYIPPFTAKALFNSDGIDQSLVEAMKKRM